MHPSVSRATTLRPAHLRRSGRVGPFNDHRSDEAVSLGRDGLDHRVAVPVLVQNLPEREDLERQVGFLDDGVGPQRLDECRFLNQVAAVLYERDEEVEWFRRKRDRLSATEQPSLAWIELEGAEVVDRKSVSHDSGTNACE